ncbi:hypothetical protein C5167_026760 [Papaver somniferum]|nr:hypothetical protein C5167_026760 [Papaver somniferum]
MALAAAVQYAMEMDTNINCERLVGWKTGSRPAGNN